MNNPQVVLMQTNGFTLSSLMFIFEYSRKLSKLMEKWLMKTSLICWALLFLIVFISEGKKKVDDHPSCTFVELEQAFYKRYKMEKNDEQIYLKLRNVKWE